MILAADIGGTNARLALFDPRTRDPLVTERYRSEAWTDAGDLVTDFLARHPATLSAACIAVAGPVRAGRSTAVNLPWTVDGDRLAAVLDLPWVSVVNDLEANARAVPLLDAAELVTLNSGEPNATGTRAVVSAGTGLGEAALWWDGHRYRAIAGEGGHADFAPRSDVEIALLRYLAADYGHVSYERLCSGNGIVNIYRFLRDRERGAAPDAWHVPAPPSPSPAAITAEAAADPRSLAAEALDLFVSIYGARAGNVALAFNATGGVYLGGGIAPRIADRLASGAFMRAFVDKGRFAATLAQIPVSIIVNDGAALIGAAAIAADEQPPAGHAKVVAIA